MSDASPSLVSVLPQHQAELDQLGRNVGRRGMLVLLYGQAEQIRDHKDTI
jgi:hypothetical protein